MEIAPDDRLAAEILFARARESLRALAALLRPSPPDAAAGVLGAAVATASRSLDGAGATLDPRAADGARTACPGCGNRVMRAATLCGFCWRRLDPSRGS
jgi:hypothetical protein